MSCLSDCSNLSWGPTPLFLREAKKELATLGPVGEVDETEDAEGSKNLLEKLLDDELGVDVALDADSRRDEEEDLKGGFWEAYKVVKEEVEHHDILSIQVQPLLTGVVIGVYLEETKEIVGESEGSLNFISRASEGEYGEE